MKFLYPALLVLSLAIISCSKSYDDGNTPAPGGGGSGTTERFWKVGGTTRTVNNYSQSAETYAAYDKDGYSINFTFSSYPPTAGTYRVIDDAATLGAGQVKVYVGAFGSNAETYVSTGSNGANATISFESSKIRIVLPETWARKASGGTDSVKLSATLSPL